MSGYDDVGYESRCPSEFLECTTTLFDNLNQLQHERRTTTSRSSERSTTGRGTLQECLEEGAEGEGEGAQRSCASACERPTDFLVGREEGRRKGPRTRRSHKEGSCRR